MNVDKLVIRGVRRIISFIGVFVCFIIIWESLRYIIVDDVSDYNRVSFHEYYNQDNIDVLFVGASLCFCDVDVNIMDERLGLNTFDLGTSGQTIDSSYFLIKEATSRYDVKHVFLEVCPIVSERSFAKNDRIGVRANEIYRVTDYTRPSLFKIEYLRNTIGPQTLIDDILVARRYWKNLYDFSKVLNILERKNQASYKRYSNDNCITETTEYIKKGYLAGKTVIHNDNYGSDMYLEDGFNPASIPEDWYIYLNTIIEFCIKNNIEITLFCAPLSNELLSNNELSYDTYHDIVDEVASNWGIKFWDFNYAKDSFLEYTSENYRDSAHMNRNGAEKFSVFFSKVILGEIDDQDAFCDSVKEKIQ